MTNTAEHHHDFYDIIQLLVRSIVPLVVGTVLLLGGVWLLTLPLPGWKLILGLPAAQLGIVVLMFAFDEITKKRFHPENFEVLICPYCNHQNLIHAEEKETYCSNCKKKLLNPNLEEEGED